MRTPLNQLRLILNTNSRILMMRTLTLMYFLALAFLWQGCADDVKWEEDNPGNSQVVSDCPPDYVKENGGCWIEDPDDRAALNSQTGEVNPEDLLNIDNEI